ncbi:unnamed protein product [Lactuca saligna]|uniref:Uncharacterized protein n=1 Tax=Lactuca saligna TaxID=75948 RepID=A0AA35ZEN7_LACSI|nr:unnamed protein product [Lactuca saligna]
MLNKIEGVSRNGALPKQGGDKEPQPNKEPQTKQKTKELIRRLMKLLHQKEKRKWLMIMKKKKKRFLSLKSLCEISVTKNLMIFRLLQRIYKLKKLSSKYAKPRFKTWSLKKICALRVKSPVQTLFKGFMGTNQIMDEFNMAYLPFMNPYDWISLLLIVKKYEQKYEFIVAHLKRMPICYVHEIAKMEIDIAYVLKKRTILKPE